MSTQLCATWHTDSTDMVVLPSTQVSRYRNCCTDGGTSPEYFGCTHICMYRRILGPVYDNEKENWRILTDKEMYATV
jgi:hypothetical protein